MSTFDHTKPFTTKRGTKCELLAVLPPEKAIGPGGPTKVIGLYRLVILVDVDDPDNRSVETYSIDGKFFATHPTIMDLVNIKEPA
jgi:hypothetical protein